MGSGRGGSWCSPTQVRCTLARSWCTCPATREITRSLPQAPGFPSTPSPAGGDRRAAAVEPAGKRPASGASPAAASPPSEPGFPSTPSPAGGERRAAAVEPAGEGPASGASPAAASPASVPSAPFAQGGTFKLCLSCLSQLSESARISTAAVPTCAGYTAGRTGRGRCTTRCAPGEKK